MSRKTFLVEGRPRRRKPYHYRESGLDDVYLENGFKIEEVDGEEYVTIENMDGLHLAIGLYLATEPKALGPRHIRFLRGAMDLTQAALARKLGVDSQSIARWEKGQTSVPGPAELLIRMLFLFTLLPEAERRPMIDRFMAELDERAEADETGSGRLLFHRAAGDGWELAQAA
jgi:DNA-binding transcriptional regulator YiaG